MLCKFQNDWNINSKWLLTKTKYKMCKWKGNKKSNHCKNCTACLRGKGKSTSHYKYDLITHATNRVPKGVVQKTRLRVSGSKCKMLTSIKCYIKLQQHFSTKILYCSNHVKSPIDFLKLKMLLGSLCISWNTNFMLVKIEYS